MSHKICSLWVHRSVLSCQPVREEASSVRWDAKEQPAHSRAFQQGKCQSGYHSSTTRPFLQVLGQYGATQGNGQGVVKK